MKGSDYRQANIRACRESSLAIGSGGRDIGDRYAVSRFLTVKTTRPGQVVFSFVK